MRRTRINPALAGSAKYLLSQDSQEHPLRKVFKQTPSFDSSRASEIHSRIKAPVPEAP